MQKLYFEEKKIMSKNSETPDRKPALVQFLLQNINRCFYGPVTLILSLDKILPCIDWTICKKRHLSRNLAIFFNGLNRQAHRYTQFIQFIVGTQSKMFLPHH